MTRGEYVLGLMTIVSGLAITEWLVRLSDVVMAGRRVRWDWLAALAALYFGYAIIASWQVSWSSWHRDQDATVFDLAHGVLQVGLLMFAARASLPKIGEHGHGDLRTHYEEQARRMWGAVTVGNGLVCALVLLRLLYSGPAFLTTSGVAWIAFALGFAVSLTLAVFRARIVHAVLLPAWVAAFVLLTIGKALVS